MPRQASILHADVDAFYASVEQRDDRGLRGRPVIVGSGVVLAASYEARAAGVRSAMGGAQARRLCPAAIVVEPRWPAYARASGEVFEIFGRTAPTVEGISIEEAFLDVAGLARISGSPREIAARLRREVRERVGLPITVGVASTKSLAKIASRIAKPDGLLVVPAGGELEFLHPLGVEALWGVGASTSRRLRARGIETIGDLARRTEAELVSIVGGARGRRLRDLALNRDRRAVRARRGRASFGSQAALSHPVSAARVDSVLVALVDRVSRRMRAAARAGRTVVLRLRFADFSRATRSRTLAQPTADGATILIAARSLLGAAAPTIRRRGLTLVGVAVTNLGAAGTGVQLPLVFDRAAALDSAVDELRDRFGSAIVARGTLAAERRLAAHLQPGDSGRGPA